MNRKYKSNEITDAVSANNNGRIYKIEPIFFTALQNIITATDYDANTINIIKRIHIRKVKKKCEKIASRLRYSTGINSYFLESFIDFLESNRDIFPEEYFKIIHTEANEICLDCNLIGYDYFKGPFLMYHHNEYVKIRIDEETRKITIKFNIGNVEYTKRFKGMLSGIGDNQNEMISSIVSNIILLCSLCYIRGDYNAIEKCFSRL